MVRLDRLKRNDKSFTELVFYENDFKSRSDNFLDLVTAILMNTTVEHVRFHDCGNCGPKWSSKQLKLLFAAIARLPKLKLLSIARTNISVQALGIVVEKAIQLRSINIWGSTLMGNDLDVEQLREAIATRSWNLSTIYLKTVSFASTITNLDPFLAACQSALDSLTLEEILWRQGAISPKVFRNLKSSSLVQLGLRKLSQLDDSHIEALGEGLQGRSLQHLTISQICLSVKAVKAITTSVSYNDSLKYLCLSKCNLSDTHMKELATALQVNTSLTTLGLSENQIGDDGAIVLANALLLAKNNASSLSSTASPSSLKVLEMQGNLQISDRGLQALLQLAEQSFVLESLRVYPLSRCKSSTTKEQMEIQKKINAFMNPNTRNGYYYDYRNNQTFTGKRPKVWYE